jgi:hypothetical protein
MSGPDDGVIDQLRALRDELRLRVHLGQMDVQDAWRELEAKGSVLERALEQQGHELAGPLRESFDELRRGLERLRATLGK